MCKLWVIQIIRVTLNGEVEKVSQEVIYLKTYLNAFENKKSCLRVSLECKDTYFIMKSVTNYLKGPEKSTTPDNCSRSLKNFSSSANEEFLRFLLLS